MFVGRMLNSGAPGRLDEFAGGNKLKHRARDRNMERNRLLENNVDSSSTVELHTVAPSSSVNTVEVCCYSSYCSRIRVNKINISDNTKHTPPIIMPPSTSL